MNIIKIIFISSKRLEVLDVGQFIDRVLDLKILVFRRQKASW